MATEQQLRAQLSQQQGALSRFRAQLSAAATRKTQYERRLSELRNIRSSLASGLTGDTDDVRRSQQGTRDMIAGGVEGVAVATGAVVVIEARYESAPPDDRYGSEILSKIDAEVSDTQAKIDEAAGEIRSSSNAMNQANANIRSLRRSIAQAKTQDMG